MINKLFFSVVVIVVVLVNCKSNIRIYRTEKSGANLKPPSRRVVLFF